MFEYIEGKVNDLTPTSVVLDCNGIGYFVNVSINTYSQLNGISSAKLYIHFVVREDAQTLYGFTDKDERKLFRLLISVSGIGSSTAIMMLSAYPPSELKSAIASEDINVLKSIKGIGLKTAQRVIIDLKDKIDVSEENSTLLPLMDNTIKEEALSALVMLGFTKKMIEKVLAKIFKEHPGINVEQVIKLALKMM